ncbi:MAG TPA: EscU/YscU/HrcU family type III secretion system export apparatus switch protein [Kofleriaceae bacterium]|nr:EscU/YscU/HrcU family type III secretion system export apparatus switch protein [Kofleriaceae bacterium]
MAAQRPFPPSARRRALARAAGLHAASPLLVGAAALAAVALVVGAAGHAARRALGVWLADACRGSNATTPSTGALATTVLELALPVLGAAALAAIVVHLAQTRAPWLPRRRIAGAPTTPPARVRRSSFELAAAFTVGAVTLGWLWAIAPRLAALVERPLVGVLLVPAFLATLAIAYVALGALDALARHAAHAAALRMTHAEQREDARLAGADPRWRKARADAARAPSARDAVASASVLLLGEDLASAPATSSSAGTAAHAATGRAASDAVGAGSGLVAIAIAWDPVRRPVPIRTAVGRGTRATQLLGLARRHAVPVHRDPVLAAALAANDGPIPEAHWPRLAEIIAATTARGAQA